MHTDIPPYLFLIFIAATAAGVILQMLILLGMFLALRKAQTKVEALIDEARVHLMPAIATSRSLIDDLGPKVTGIINDLGPKLKTVSSNVVETSNLVRREVENVKGAVDEVVGKTRGQAARVDGIVTGTLNGVEHATATIQHGVSIPIRKLSGWVAGLQAGLAVLRSKRERSPAAVHSEDPFVGTPAPTSYAYSKQSSVSDKDFVI